MDPKLLFLISSQMQAGKDVFGNALASATRGYTIAFANPVKEVAISMLGMPSAIAYGGEAERRAWKRYCIDPKTCRNRTHEACSDARQWLQWIGTELGRRMIHPQVWIHRFLDRARHSSARALIVTDARFENELFQRYDDTKWMLEMATFVEESYPFVFKPVRIRLKRPGHENNDPHPSEAEQLRIPDSKFDHVVVNDGTPSELAGKAAQIAKEYVAF